MKSTIISFCFLLFLTITFRCGDPGSAAGTGLVLKDVLGKLSQEIDQIILNAQSAGLILETEAASQMKIVIEQAKLAYEDDLNKTVAALSKGEQKVFDDLQMSISNLNNGIITDITHIQDVIAMVPGMKLVPQIQEVDGNIIAPNQENASFVIKGNFYNVMQKGYSANLKIGDSIFYPIVKENHQIEFHLPKSIFKTPEKKVDYVSCEIQINYVKSKFIFFDSKDLATFSEKLILLPSTFGKVVLETNIPKAIRVTKENQICGPLTWSSKNGNIDNGVKGCDIEPGWNCDIQSVREQGLGEEGSFGKDWFDQGNYSTLSKVQWQLLTTPKSGMNPKGHDGVRAINLIYSSWQPSTRDEIVNSEPIELTWGKQIVLDIPISGTWKLVFTKYNGQKFEIASTDQKSNLIKLKNIGNKQLSIQVVPFDNL